MKIFRKLIAQGLGLFSLYFPSLLTSEILEKILGSSSGFATLEFCRDYKLKQRLGTCCSCLVCVRVCSCIFPHLHLSYIIISYASVVICLACSVLLLVLLFISCRVFFCLTLCVFFVCVYLDNHVSPIICQDHDWSGHHPRL